MNALQFGHTGILLKVIKQGVVRGNLHVGKRGGRTAVLGCAGGSGGSGSDCGTLDGCAIDKAPPEWIAPAGQRT